MYDTARRVALVKQRVRENTRRRQRREAISLSAACMLLCAALMQTAGTVVGPGQTAAWGVFGAMLLREDVGGYVLVLSLIHILCTATKYCQHVIPSLIIRYIRMGTLDRQEGLNYYGKQQGICLSLIHI